MRTASEIREVLDARLAVERHAARAVIGSGRSGSAPPPCCANRHWVHDEPLLRYLGAQATEPKFRATKFPPARAVPELAEIASRPGANDKSRVSRTCAPSTSASPAAAEG